MSLSLWWQLLEAMIYWLIPALESKLLDIQTFYQPIVRLVSLKWAVIKLFIPQKLGKHCKPGLLFWTAFISTPLSQALSPSLWWSWKCTSQIPNCKELNWLLASAAIPWNLPLLLPQDETSQVLLLADNKHDKKAKVGRWRSPLTGDFGARVPW